MKNITKLFLGAFLVSLSVSSFAQQTCGTYTYHTSNAGWSNSEYYKIIDIDAAALTSTSLPQFTGAEGSKNALETDFNSGTFTTPVMTTTDGIIYTPTNVMWPVKYKMVAFAPTMYNSAYTKVNLLGTVPSGNSGATASCTVNDNSAVQSGIWNKQGFIELSRLGASTAEPTISRHGYIEINDLPSVERIQWSYSSTAWKRGVKCDVNYNDGNGWVPLRWEPSDLSSSVLGITTFSEQGYQFEEIIGKQDDPTSKISLRIRIWDGDSIHLNPLKTDGTTYTTVNSPLAQKQTVRVHQIKVFSAVIPTEAPSAVSAVNANNIKIYLSGNNIVLGEEANVELYTVEGKKMYKGLTKLVDVTGFSKGVYIIKATDSNGKIQNKKIII